jgi:hypothetical protein
VASHPANLALRFVLELTALIGLAWWGSSLADGWPGVLLAVAVPLVAAAIWGTFAVPDDPSRSGEAPVAVRGWIRLAVELVTLGGGVGGYFLIGRSAIAGLFLLALIIHYLLSLDRIRWLLER